MVRTVAGGCKTNAIPLFSTATRFQEDMEGTLQMWPTEVYRPESEMYESVVSKTLRWPPP
jgi:hypothetical protein